jgi:hypothetical protein
MEHDQQAIDILFTRQVFRATERAMERAACAAHEDLKAGLNTLATIASIAPFVGILGTLWAIGFDTFFGLGNEKSTGLAMVAEGISRACVPTALGLLVGLQSLWAYRYLRGRLADFDREMADAPVSLVNQLAILFGRLRPVGSIEDVSTSLPYLTAYSPDLHADRKDKSRTALIAIALVLAAWCVRVVAYFELDAVPLNSAMSAGVRSVIVTFCCSCLPAYAVWVDLLHRTTTKVALIAAALCLFWCAAGLLFPDIRF